MVAPFSVFAKVETKSVTENMKFTRMPRAEFPKVPISIRLIGASISNYVEESPMFNIFKKDPAKKLEKQIEQLSEQAVHYQRNGKLREYADLMAKIEELNKELEAIEKNKSKS